MKVLRISPKYHFPKLPKIMPRKGEKRPGYFWRIFRGQFGTEEQAEINKFFEGYAWQPMDPKWKKCYLVSAFQFFKYHPTRDRIISALYYADLTYARPKIAAEVLEEIQRIWEAQQLTGKRKKVRKTKKPEDEQPGLFRSTLMKFFKVLEGK